MRYQFTIRLLLLYVVKLLLSTALQCAHILPIKCIQEQEISFQKGKKFKPKMINVVISVYKSSKVMLSFIKFLKNIWLNIVQAITYKLCKKILFIHYFSQTENHIYEIFSQIRLIQLEYHFIFINVTDEY